MPANLAATSPSGVLPQSLCTAVTESRVFPIIETGYHDATVERSIIQDGVNAPQSLRSWKLAKRLTAAQVSALRTFLESHPPGSAFYFYNPMEPQAGHAIGSNYDATGASSQGRHSVMFSQQQWSEITDLARTVVPLELVEVA